MKSGPELLEDFLDGELSAEERAEFARWLEADPEHLREFVRATHLHRQLRDAMRTQQHQAQLMGTPAKQSSGRLKSFSPLAFRFLLRALVPLAVCVAVVLVGIHYFALQSNPVVLPFSGAGQALVLERDSRRWPITTDTRLNKGDYLETGSNSVALIRYPRERTRFILAENSVLLVLSSRHGKEFQLIRGRIEGNIAHQPKSKPMRWKTTHAIAVVLGTELSLETDAKQSRLEVLDGSVRFTSQENGQSVLVAKDQASTAAAGGKLQVETFAYGRGNILRELWLGISGIYIGSLTRSAAYPDKPNRRDLCGAFSCETNWISNSGVRLRGYIHPPQSGEYIFWIKGGDTGELFLSSDELPANGGRIASFSQSARGRWDTYPWQQSRRIHLEAGRKYYIEALFKESDQGTDYGVVAWQPPGGKRAIVEGRFLSPFRLRSASRASGN